MEQNSFTSLSLSQRSEQIEVYQLDLDLASKLRSINWSAEYPVLCEKGQTDHEDLPMVTSCLLEEIIDESEIVDESESVSLCNSVTHIEIIKAKAIAPRRVSGANRVVPFITSVWQNSSCNISEPSLSKLYRDIMDNPNCTDDTECRICFQRLLSSYELEHHVVSIHGLSPSSEQCFVCRRKFVFQIDLKTHLSKYHGIQFPEMICKICFMEFHSQIENKAHERKHDKVLNCGFCSMKFASEYFYQCHFDNHLAGFKPFACNKCGVRYCNSISLNIHQKRHLQFSCFCESSFDDELKFLLHLSTHEPEEQEVFLTRLEGLDEEETRFDKMLGCYVKTTESLADCSQSSNASIERDIEICVEGLLVSVTTPVTVDVEKRTSLVPGSNCVECKLCGVEVPSGKVMMDHHRKSHLRNRTCLFCGKRSASVPQTLRHMATHLDEKLTSVTSRVDPTKDGGANITSVRKRKGRKYVSNFRTAGPVANRPVYSCSSCSQTFRSKVTRDKHLLLHTDEIKTTLQCTVCNQLFLRPKFLEKHMVQHENNYQCETCGKCCSSHTKLRAHLRSHAPVDVRQKFKCSFCAVSCSTFSGLRVHLRVHTGERPYACVGCKKTFKRLQAMKKHALVVHGGPESVSHACRECPVRFNDRGNLFRHFLLVHRGFRRFICGVCGHRYGQNQDLQRHLKMKHRVDAPSITGKAKKSANDIYVIPSLDDLPLSDSHAATIRRIVDEEKLKFKCLEDLDMVLEDNSDDATNEIQPLTIDSSLEVSQSDDPLPNEQQYVLENLPDVNQQPLEEVVQDFQPQFIPLLGLLAQVGIGTNQASQTSGVNTSFKLQTCDLCNKLFYVDSTFNEHVQKREEHSCKECPAKFCDAEKLQDHVTKEHTSNIIYQCGICMVQFSHTSSLMQQHMNEAHGMIDPNANSSLTTNCLLGDNTIHQLQLTSTLSTSKNSCLGNDIFVPNVVFQSALPINSMPPGFSDHRHNILQPQSLPPVFILQSSNMVSLPVPQPPTCVTQQETVSETSSVPSSSSELPATDVCPPTDATRGRKCGPRPSDSLDCKQCGKLFVDRKRLIRHMNTHLGPCKPFGCPQCNKGFSEKHNLKVHMRTHTGERPYSCEDCGKTMRYQKEFADHKRMHEGTKPCVCEECGRKFLRRRELVRHVLTHTGEKRFQCAACDKRFCRADQLTVHTRCHVEPTADRLFVCHFCDKAYRSKTKLQGHLVLHTGEKKHRCPLCDKSFALVDYLKSHIKTHRKRDTYVACPKCPRKFSSHDNLEIHLKTFHTKHKKRGTSLKASADVESAMDKSSDRAREIDELTVMEAMLLGPDRSGIAYLQTVHEDLARALDNIPTS